MSLELHERYRIVFLSKDVYGPKFSINQIAKVMKCNKTTVKRWINRWKETKDLSDRMRQGRLQATTAETDQLIVDLVQEDIEEGLTSKHIQQELQDQGVNISRAHEKNFYKSLRLNANF
ncbi:unnamed protein product [Rotaria sp. Silwood2]|nr:unnamed protein product [Rotaria sp. Silwood2]